MTEKNKTKQLNIKKIIVISFLVLIVIIFGVFMLKNRDNHILKSEYGIHELGYLDKIEVTLEQVNYIHNNTGIELTFKITNQTDNTITITPDDYFKFYDINEVQIPNKNTSNKKIVKKDETITYKLQYDVTKKELYEIYFYSQIVENNIKFSFTSSDISEEVINDDNITQEEKTE